MADLCDGKTSIEYSGSPFVNVVQSVQDRARPDGASHRAQLRFRCLQSERSMRTVLVVIPNEFRQHRPQVLLVEDDHVVQTFLAECPDNAFGNCVRTRRSNGRGDGVDTDASGPPAEVAAVDGISIAQQMPRLAITWRQTQAAVGLAVRLTCTSSRRPWAMNTRTYSVLNVSVGTVNRSVAHKWWA